MKNKLSLILICMLISTMTFAQQRLTGIVKTAGDGEAIPGATVVVKGTNRGITTDMNGEFFIDAPDNGMLVVSFVGYKTREIPVNKSKFIEVILSEELAELSEVIVVGYGTQKKSDITGSVASVKLADLERIPSARADEILQGLVSGVQITNNDASPNANVSIRIRGVGSINGGSDPLIIADGVQGVQMRDIHPDDIKSIEVLKDASATSIYGSRGANGVVLITTKKGSSQKPVLTYSAYASVQQVRKKIDLMDAWQYANYLNNYNQTIGQPLLFSDEQLSELQSGGGTDWQNEIFRLGISQNHHVSINGGSDHIRYKLSGDYIQTDGIVIGSSYEKYSVSPYFSAKINENMSVNLDGFVSWSIDKPTELFSRDDQGSPIYAALVFSPTRSVYEPNGNYTQPGGGIGPNTEYNPVALALEPIRENYSNRIRVNPSIDYKITDNLQASIRMAYQLTDSEADFYYNEKVRNGGSATRSASISNSKWSRYQNTNILTYDKEINKHHLKLTGVFEQQKTISTWSYINVTDFPNNEVRFNKLEAGSNLASASSNREEDSLESFMGRINYSYKDKYLLTITGRSDAASVFAENNKRAFFPSMALGWNAAREHFLKDSKVIGSLKLRASYGEVGNAAILPYQSLAQLEAGSNFSFSGGSLTTGIILSPRAANPDLKWETTRQLNLGFDMGLLGNQITLNFDYYKKNTEDLLLERQLKQASGYQSQLVNAGEVENEGIEISLSGTPVNKNGFKWTSNFTFARNKNTVLALNDMEKNILLGDGEGAGLPGFTNSIWLEVGQGIGLVKGYEYAGVWKSEESILAAAYGLEPGDPKYTDQNNDGKINADDYVNIANALPDYTFGWTNNFTYKNFDLNILVTGVQGNDVYNIAQSVLETPGVGTSVNLLNTWSPENENTNVPGHISTGRQRNSSQWVEDGSYVRIKDISLGYRFPGNWIKTLGLSSARIYCTASNLFTFTNYSGYDPEANSAIYTASNNERDSYAGIDLASYPSQKKLTMGLYVKF